jgi:hypothetical protein
MDDSAALRLFGISIAVMVVAPSLEHYMKGQKQRFTQAQFDQALIDQIEHARNINLPVNALSSAATFTALVGLRLFGKDCKRSAALTQTLGDLIAEAKAERAQEEIARESTLALPRNRIVVPGDPRNRN